MFPGSLGVFWFGLLSNARFERYFRSFIQAFGALRFRNSLAVKTELCTRNSSETLKKRLGFFMNAILVAGVRWCRAAGLASDIFYRIINLRALQLAAVIDVYRFPF